MLTLPIKLCAECQGHRAAVRHQRMAQAECHLRTLLHLEPPSKDRLPGGSPAQGRQGRD